MVEEKSLLNISKEFIGDVRHIIETGRQQAYAATNYVTIVTYWHIGRRIVEEEQKGNHRAQYGSRLIEGLAIELRQDFGASYNKRNLDYFRRFYLCYKDLEIVNELVHNLTWTHIRRALSVTDPIAQQWYLTHASKDMWSTTTLDRNCSDNLNTPKSCNCYQSRNFFSGSTLPTP